MKVCTNSFTQLQTLASGKAIHLVNQGLWVCPLVSLGFLRRLCIMTITVTRLETMQHNAAPNVLSPMDLVFRPDLLDIN